MKKILLISILVSFKCLYAQPTIEWEKSLGATSGYDSGKSIQQTADGGYVVAGRASSESGDVSGFNGGWYDIWVVKLSPSGIIDWQKCLGGIYQEEANSIQQTADGGYIVAGYTWSNNGDASGNHGSSDMWVVKLSPLGIIEWQKCLGGSGRDEARSIQQTMDGGYIVAGWTQSNDGDVSGYHGNRDMWVVKLSSLGVIEWQKCFGGSDDDDAKSIQQTTDGGYIVAGWTQSNDGDVSGHHGNRDMWVVKLSPSGVIDWQKYFGGSDDDDAKSIQQTTDGGYIVAGYTESNDGDVSGNHGNSDFWVVKLNTSGVIIWQKCLGGSWNEQARSIQQTTDGGYVVAGWTQSDDGDVSGDGSGPYVTWDIWVVKLSSSGVLDWEKNYGDNDNGADEADSIQQTTDGGYILSGTNEQRIWVIKLPNYSLGVTETKSADALFSIYPNPVVNEFNVKIDASLLGSYYTIYDQSGKRIITGKLDIESSVIDINHLSKGVYVFSLADKTNGIKLIKQ